MNRKRKIIICLCIILLFVLVAVASCVFSGSNIVFNSDDLLTDGNNIPLGESDWYVWKRGQNFNIYRYNQTREFMITHAMCTLNYQEVGNDSWQPVGDTIEVLPNGHWAWDWGYRAWFTRNRYHAFFKPNAVDDKTVAFIYNRSYAPDDFKAITTNLKYMGYLDVTDIDNPVVLQTVQDSQGFINGSYGMYPDCFYDTDVKWSVTSEGIKEDIIIGEYAKQWLQNHPPSSYGLSNQDSYFVIATEITTHGLNLSYLGQYINHNFSAWNGSIFLKNALGKIKAVLPVDNAYELNNESNRVKLLYRIIQHNSKIFLLSGIKVINLNQLEAPVVIDPTIDCHIGAGTDDCYETSSGSVYNDNNALMYIGAVSLPSFVYDSYFRYSDLCIPSNSIISSAVLNLFMKRYGGLAATSHKYNISCLDVDNRATFSSTDKPSQNVTTENYTNWEFSQFVSDGSFSWRTAPDISSSIQEVVNRTGWYSGNALAVAIKDNSSNQYCQLYSYDNNPAFATWIKIIYTAPDNYAPTVSNPYPVNQSIQQEGNPILSVDVNDSEGDVFTVSWYTNISGTWTLVQTNSSVTNGTFTYRSGVTTGDTLYHWNVTVVDEQDTNESVFYFTTGASIVISNVIPVDEKLDETYPVILQATFNTPDGFIFNITWYDYETRTVLNIDTLESNGTHSFIWNCTVGLHQWNITACYDNISTDTNILFFCSNDTWDDDFWNWNYSRWYNNSNHFMNPFIINNSWFNFTGIYNNTLVDNVGLTEIDIATSALYTEGSMRWGASPRICFENSTHGWVVYAQQRVSSTSYPVIKSTTDGGKTWSAYINLGGTYDVYVAGISIWYDQWTYGNNGTNIYISYSSKYNDSTQFIRYDTATGYRTFPPITVREYQTFEQGDYGGTSICQTEDGRLWVLGFGYKGSHTHSSGVSYSDDNGLTWIDETPGVLFDDLEDNGQLIPQGDDVLLLYHDTGGRVREEEEIYNLTYNSSTGVWDTWSFDTSNHIFDIKTGLTDIATWGATYNMRSRDVYVSAASHRTPYTIEVWCMDGTTGAWSECVSWATDGWTWDCKPVISQGNGDIYIVYNNETSAGAGTNDLMYKVSTDNGTTWSADLRISSVSNDYYAYTTTCFMNYEKLYVGCFLVEDTFDPFYGFQLANYSKDSFYPDTANISSTNINKPVGTNWYIFNASVVGDNDYYSFDVYSSDGTLILSNVYAGDNVRTITNDSIYLVGNFNGTCSLNRWNVSWYIPVARSATTIYIRGGVHIYGCRIGNG